MEELEDTNMSAKQMKQFALKHLYLVVLCLRSPPPHQAQLSPPPGPAWKNPSNHHLSQCSDPFAMTHPGVVTNSSLWTVSPVWGAGRLQAVCCGPRVHLGVCHPTHPHLECPPSHTHCPPPGQWGLSDGFIHPANLPLVNPCTPDTWTPCMKPSFTAERAFRKKLVQRWC